MKRWALILAALLLSSALHADGIINGGGSGGAPSGAAGGGLTGSYPNPTVAAVPSSALPFNSAVLSIGASNPTTGTASTVGVMMGIGATCAITPAKSTRVLLTVIGAVVNSSTGGYGLSLREGTGVAPANLAAATGTTLSNTLAAGAAGAGIAQAFSMTAIASGLTPGTAIWFDIDLAAVTTGTVSLTGLTCSAVEL
jgi:hypothetical protein